MPFPRKLPPHVVETIAYMREKTRADAQARSEGARKTMQAANERFWNRAQEREAQQQQEAAE